LADDRQGTRCSVDLNGKTLTDERVQVDRRDSGCPGSVDFNTEVNWPLA